MNFGVEYGLVLRELELFGKFKIKINYFIKGEINMKLSEMRIIAKTSYRSSNPSLPSEDCLICRNTGTRHLVPQTPKTTITFDKKYRKQLSQLKKIY